MSNMLYFQQFTFYNNTHQSDLHLDCHSATIFRAVCKLNLITVVSPDVSVLRLFDWEVLVTDEGDVITALFCCKKYVEAIGLDSLKLKCSLVRQSLTKRYNNELRKLVKADEDESKSNLESYTFKFSVDESAKHMQTHSIFEVFEKEMITPTFVTPTMQKQWFDMLLRTDGVLQTMIFSHNQKKILFRSSIERDVPQQYLCITEPNSNNVIWNTVYSCCTHTLSKEKKRVYAYQIATHLYIFVAAVPQLEKSAFLITYYSSLVAHSDGNKKYYPTLKSERGEILSHVEFTEIEISKFSLDVNRELTRTLDAIENAFPPPMLKKKESESIIDVKPKQNPLIFENVQTEQPEAKEEPKEEPRPDAEQVVHRPVRHYHTTFSSATSFDGSSPPVSGLVPKPPPLPPLSTPVAPKPPSMPNQNTFVRKKIFEPPAEKTQVETLAGEDSKNPIAQESNEKIFYQRGS